MPVLLFLSCFVSTFLEVWFRKKCIKLLIWDESTILKPINIISINVLKLKLIYFVAIPLLLANWICIQ